MAKKLTNVIVKRRRWFRGNGPDESLLRQPRGGHMCCLGFACMASGAKAKQISGMGMPYEMETDAGRPAWSTAENFHLVDEIAKVNDDHNISDDVREHAIRLRGRALGLRFSFVG